MYNLSKLTLELRAENIPFHGILENGTVQYKNEATQVQKDLTESIKTAHVSTWYKEQRQDAYATISDQLDMQYWDKVNNTTTWKDHIASVKAQYPVEVI